MLDKNSARTARWMRALTAAIAVAMTSTLVACSDASDAKGLTDPTSASIAAADDDEAVDNTVYTQVEFLGNPLVSEVTILKKDHDGYNRSQPYASSVYGPQSLAFINAFREKQPNVAATLGAVLYPDMLIVESAQNPGKSGWLTWALLPGEGWGGRNLEDDVVDAGLMAIFGPLLDKNGTYCSGDFQLCTDNVGANEKAFLGSFPYLAAPTLK